MNEILHKLKTISSQVPYYQPEDTGIELPSQRELFGQLSVKKSYVFEDIIIEVLHYEWDARHDLCSVLRFEINGNKYYLASYPIMGNMVYTFYFSKGKILPYDVMMMFRVKGKHEPFYAWVTEGEFDYADNIDCRGCKVVVKDDDIIKFCEDVLLVMHRFHVAKQGELMS